MRTKSESLTKMQLKSKTSEKPQKTARVIKLLSESSSYVLSRVSRPAKRTPVITISLSESGKKRGTRDTDALGKAQVKRFFFFFPSFESEPLTPSVRLSVTSLHLPLFFQSHRNITRVPGIEILSYWHLNLDERRLVQRENMHIISSDHLMCECRELAMDGGTGCMPHPGDRCA